MCDWTTLCAVSHSDKPFRGTGIPARLPAHDRHECLRSLPTYDFFAVCTCAASNTRCTSLLWHFGHLTCWWRSYSRKLISTVNVLRHCEHLYSYNIACTPIPADGRFLAFTLQYITACKLRAGFVSAGLGVGVAHTSPTRQRRVALVRLVPSLARRAFMLCDPNQFAPEKQHVVANTSPT